MQAIYGKTVIQGKHSRIITNVCRLSLHLCVSSCGATSLQVVIRYCVLITKWKLIHLHLKQKKDNTFRHKC